MSGVRLARHYFEQMATRTEGRIIFVSSESAVQVAPDMLHYSMTKAAQLSLSRGLAELTRGTNVTVNTVLPGSTWTEGLGCTSAGWRANTDSARRRRRDSSSVLGGQRRCCSATPRPARWRTIFTYLASSAASATNGAALRVEGGVLRSIA
jgi:NAD(P)-dependent dehydrogenase (short-subunit alcohol dehydrogenase family)